MKARLAVKLEEKDCLCSVKIATDGFAADWDHCDQLSNYVSHVVSFDKPDAFAFSNLLSTVVNEILEVIYKNHGSGDPITLTLYQVGRDTVIVCEVTVNDDARTFYLKAADNLQSGDVESRYRESIMGNEEIPQEIGFFELAADYGAHIDIEDIPEKNRVRLTVRVYLNKLNGGNRE